MRPAPKNPNIDHEPLSFGKHKGLTPEVVSSKDPGWLIWAYETVNQRDVCSEALYLATKQDRDDDALNLR